MRVIMFRAWGLRFKAQVLGFRVHGSGSRAQVSGPFGLRGSACVADRGALVTIGTSRVPGTNYVYCK